MALVTVSFSRPPEPAPPNQRAGVKSTAFGSAGWAVTASFQPSSTTSSRSTSPIAAVDDTNQTNGKRRIQCLSRYICIQAEIHQGKHSGCGSCALRKPKWWSTSSAGLARRSGHTTRGAATAEVQKINSVGSIKMNPAESNINHKSKWFKMFAKLVQRNNMFFHQRCRCRCQQRRLKLKVDRIQ